MAARPSRRPGRPSPTACSRASTPSATASCTAGSRFDGPTRITPEVLEVIRSLADLAPLHNPIDLAVIEAASSRAPRVPGVAVFDTAFHRTLPEVAWRYALPAGVGADAELRRYGF